ncbi:MAG: glycosyltransferase family 9 protein [Kiritimatiellia bacterium]
MRILIVKLSSLGDIFHALPAVHSLKTGTGASIDWVAGAEYVEIVNCFNDVSNVISFPRKGFFRKFREFRADLRKNSYDYVIDLQGLFKSGVVTFLARGNRKAGPSFHREFSRIFYKETAGARDKNRHAVEECLEVAVETGGKRIEPVFPVTFPESKIAPERPAVAILSGARWPTKIWPAGRFAEAAKRLMRENGADIYLLGGKDDVDICRSVAGKLGGKAHNLCGKTSLCELGGILKEMDLLIANDSGPVHMSAAVGTPVLAVFGPTDPRRTGPYGKGHRVITGDTVCRPCFKRRCSKARLQCMESITAEEVSATAGEMLEQGRRR